MRPCIRRFPNAYPDRISFPVPRQQTRCSSLRSSARILRPTGRSRTLSSTRSTAAPLNRTPRREEPSPHLAALGRLRPEPCRAPRVGERPGPGRARSRRVGRAVAARVRRDRRGAPGRQTEGQARHGHGQGRGRCPIPGARAAHAYENGDATVSTQEPVEHKRVRPVNPSVFRRSLARRLAETNRAGRSVASASSRTRSVWFITGHARGRPAPTTWTRSWFSASTASRIDLFTLQVLAMPILRHTQNRSWFGQSARRHARCLPHRHRHLLLPPRRHARAREYYLGARWWLPRPRTSPVPPHARALQLPVLTCPELLFPMQACCPGRDLISILRYVRVRGVSWDCVRLFARHPYNTQPHYVGGFDD